MAPLLLLQRPEEPDSRNRSEAAKYGRATQQFRHFGIKSGTLIAENPKDEQNATETESDRNKAAEGNAKHHRKRIHFRAPLTCAFSGLQCLA